MVKFGVPQNPEFYPANVYNTGRPGPLNPNPELSTRSESLPKKFQPPLGYYYNRGGYSNNSGMRGMSYKEPAVLPQLSQMPFADTGNTYYTPTFEKGRIDLSKSNVIDTHDHKPPKKDAVPVPTTKALPSIKEDSRDDEQPE